MSLQRNAMKAQRRENKKNGIWIRVQYFNIILGLFIWALLMVVIMTFMPYAIRWLGADVIPDESSVRSFPEFLFGYGLWYLLPLGLLSVLNAFVFGRKLCYVSKKGLQFGSNDGNIIAWEDIEVMRYDPAVISRHEIKFCSTRFERVIGMPLEVEHFPLYGILLIKCFAPHIRIRLTGWGWFVMGLYFILPVVFDIVVSFA